MSVYVTRVTVESWPTDDGDPWPRFVTLEDLINDDALAWLRAFEAESGLDEFWVGDDQAGDPIGWLLPKTGRKNWFSVSAAKRWAERARSLGAVVTVETSEPVEWKVAR